MNFQDTPSEADFRAAARSWLAAHAPAESELAGLERTARARLWQKRKFDGGWACIQWPREHGGRGATAFENVIFSQEEARLVDINMDDFAVTHGIAAPTIMRWANEADKGRFLPHMASGKDIWCQLFSEPAGGSDLAALRTRAVRCGQDWVINGQKIWTSRAHLAEWGVLIVRTDPNVPKHKGLTYFFINMKSPGIDIRPIRQLSGGSDFNEVFFTNVRVPDSQRLGAVGEGWKVALSTLMNERASLAARDDGINLDTLIAFTKRVLIDGRPAFDDLAVRARLATWYVQEAGLKFTTYRALSALSRGETPGPENSIGKLASAGRKQDMASFAIDLLGVEEIVRETGYFDIFGSLFQDAYLASPGSRLAGGTDEILTNIIAERVLGLPQEIRLDKDMPFIEVPTAGQR